MRTAFGCPIKRYAMTSFDAWQTNFVSDSIRCGTNRRGWYRFGAWQINFVFDSIRCGTDHRCRCLLGCRLFFCHAKLHWLPYKTPYHAGFRPMINQFRVRQHGLLNKSWGWHRFGVGFAVVAHVILGLEPGIPLSPIMH